MGGDWWCEEAWAEGGRLRCSGGRDGQGADAARRGGGLGGVGGGWRGAGAVGGGMEETDVGVAGRGCGAEWGREVGLRSERMLVFDVALVGELGSIIVEVHGKRC